ncbi:hypothetical protein WJX74_005967 [Apatococcus lobatus]|uniref:Chitin-binding type-2 domain-containing protein n=1 Tax=Apatococcus lobatus TaxID=904363 RepID=A0AAW1RR91_9CHLO
MSQSTGFENRWTLLPKPGSRFRFFCALMLASCSPVLTAPTFIVPLATNQVVPAVRNSNGIGLGILDFQGPSIGYAVTVSNLSSILAADIRMGIPGQSGMSITALYPTPSQACGLATGLVYNPASDCSTFFNCSAALGPRLQACPAGFTLGINSTSCTAAPDFDCPLPQPLPFAQGTVNGILAEGLLDAASISGLSSRDPISAVLAAAQSSQLYLDIRTTSYLAGELRGNF